ncbi:signal transducing adapter molecule 1-like [Macrosteles quadrilineatus]|uniref:signal transducing adapter molecule 1-like n=1 Tax=Macrosteles quadrilineatus TaxID=74068 RepID=UPI0023E0A28A|nr:signal transducing adapter molecule 1-like [Macrosteles quadrilineatus]
MGLFSTTSPFDADVEKATDEKNTTEEWSVIMEICDKIGNSSQNAKDCLRSIVKRLNNPDPHIVMQAITLLDACVNNCGKVFHLEVSSRDFETELRKLLTKSQTKEVADKLRQLLKKWAEGEFKTDAQLSLIPHLYNKLKQEGHDFSSSSDPSPKAARSSLPKDPNAVSSQQEVDDIAKAIELSLKESQSPKYQGSSASGGGSGGGGSLYPSTTLGSTTTAEPRKVRALYDFEAVEDNELTFLAGEIIHLLDDSDPNWWKGYNQRGEGLFPANFVTSDLTVEPEKFKEPKKGVQFSEVVQVKTLKPVEQVEIEEDKIDKLLHMLHEADPTDLENDPEELLQLEEQVNAMGPLIDSELERVDRKHAQLTQVSSGLVEALNLYHMLMREPQSQFTPKPVQPFPQHPMYGRMSGPPGPVYSMPPGPEYVMGPLHHMPPMGPPGPPPSGPYSLQGPPGSRPEELQGPPSLPPQSMPYPNCYGAPFPGSGPVMGPPPGGPFPPPPNSQPL